MGDWLSRHWERIAAEWHVIWEAKSLFGTFAVLLVAATAAGVWNVGEWHHAGTEASLQATNDMLREELKGSSPQLAAIQARHAAARAQLLKFYTEAGELKGRREPQETSENHGATISEWDDKFIRDEERWERETTDWIYSNLGEAAKDRFTDIDTISGSGYYTSNFNPRLWPAYTRVVLLARNLSALIESSAFDK